MNDVECEKTSSPSLIFVATSPTPHYSTRTLSWEHQSQCQEIFKISLIYLCLTHVECHECSAVNVPKNLVTKINKVKVSTKLWSSLHSFSKKGRSQVDLQDQVCQTESLTEDVALRKNGKFKM